MIKMIKRKIIDSAYSEDGINLFIAKKNIKKKNIINITENGKFTTLWYWKKKTK